MTALERAARAARDDAAIYGADLTVEQAAHVARAVLLAVREPEVRFVYVGDALVGRSDMIFTAMIDAILNEKDTTND